LDPKAIQRDFLSRPFTNEAAKCWEAAFRAFKQWMKNHSSEAELVTSLSDALRLKFLHDFHLLPISEQDRLQKTNSRYEALWRKGHLGGREMTATFTDFIRLMRALELDFTNDPRWRELKSLLRRIKLELPEMDLDCDPKIRRLARAISRAESEAR
jgi:hypothetical protein